MSALKRWNTTLHVLLVIFILVGILLPNSLVLIILFYLVEPGVEHDQQMLHPAGSPLEKTAQSISIAKLKLIVVSIVTSIIFVSLLVLLLHIIYNRRYYCGRSQHPSRSRTSLNSCESGLSEDAYALRQRKLQQNGPRGPAGRDANLPCNVMGNAAPTIAVEGDAGRDGGGSGDGIIINGDRLSTVNRPNSKNSLSTHKSSSFTMPRSAGSGGSSAGQIPNGLIKVISSPIVKKVQFAPESNAQELSIEENEIYSRLD